VDEILQLFLVLVDAPVGLVAKHAPLLDEVLESRPEGADIGELIAHRIDSIR